MRYFLKTQTCYTFCFSSRKHWKSVSSLDDNVFLTRNAIAESISHLPGSLPTHRHQAKCFVIYIYVHAAQSTVYLCKMVSCRPAEIRIPDSIFALTLQKAVTKARWKCRLPLKETQKRSCCRPECSWMSTGPHETRRLLTSSVDWWLPSSAHSSLLYCVRVSHLYACTLHFIYQIYLSTTEGLV